MKKRHKNRYSIITNDINLALFVMVFERGQAYIYDIHKKKKVKCICQGNGIGFPKGKYLKDHIIIEFFSREYILYYFGKLVKKHFIERG